MAAYLSKGIAALAAGVLALGCGLPEPRRITVGPPAPGRIAYLEPTADQYQGGMLGQYPPAPATAPAPSVQHIYTMNVPSAAEQKVLKKQAALLDSQSWLLFQEQMRMAREQSQQWVDHIGDPFNAFNNTVNRMRLGIVGAQLWGNPQYPRQ